jgi:hypothetical protein
MKIRDRSTQMARIPQENDKLKFTGGVAADGHIL